MKLYRALLLIIALLLVVALMSCTAGSNDAAARKDSSNVNAPASMWSGDHPMRLLLGGAKARDSASVVTELAVDQTLREVLDSIRSAKFLTLNYRDSLARLAQADGKKGIDVEELGRQLNLDGVIFANVARFGNVLAMELSINEPKTGRPIYRDVEFSMIRFRDSSETLLLGPALLDAVRKAVGKYFGVAHTPQRPIATEPLIISGIGIPRDASLGRIGAIREELSRIGVGGIGEYVRLAFPELVAFDVTSRNRLYTTVNVGAVEDLAPISDLERKAMYAIGVDRFLTASIAPMSGDSAQLNVEVRYVVSPTRDSLIDSQRTMLYVKDFSTTTIHEDFLRFLLESVQPLAAREAERVRNAYIHRPGGSAK